MTQREAYKPARKTSLLSYIAKDFARNKYKYLMILPVLVYFVIFSYKPMYGVIIAFKNYRPTLGIAKSRWVGLEHFAHFLTDVYFIRILTNTFLISIYSIFWGFPAPIILALLLNELNKQSFKRTVQTVTYIPHFISIVIICGLIKQYCLTDGLFNDIRVFLGMERLALLQEQRLFRTIYIASGIWQEIGWNSIIYLASLSSIDPQLYEAAEIDGAGRLRQTWHVTLPGIMPTIVMLLILRMGSILGVGYEKILLLYNSTTYATGDVISTYVYRKGLIEADWSYSTAIGLFNSVVNVFFLTTANAISKRISSVGLF